MAPALRALWHPACRLHEGVGHFERPARLEAALEGLRASGLDVAFDEAPRITEPELRRIHTAEQVESVRRACAEGAMLDADTYTQPTSWEAALHGAGAALEAARSVLRGVPAFALPRPPGHHATPTHAMGFCLFSNIALAADLIAREGKRVAVVDIDVHHGNGTQDAFYARGDVLFADMHGWPIYPGTGAIEETGADAGAGMTLNVPLPSATSTDGWLEVFHATVAPKLRAFRPDAILVSAGFDADHRDPIGNLLLAPRAFHEAVATLRAITPRIGAVLEGGYDVDAVRDGAHAVAAALVGEPLPKELAARKEPDGGRPWAQLAPRVLAAHPDIA